MSKEAVFISTIFPLLHSAKSQVVGLNILVFGNWFAPSFNKVPLTPSGSVLCEQNPIGPSLQLLSER